MSHNWSRPAGVGRLNRPEGVGEFAGHRTVEPDGLFGARPDTKTPPPRLPFLSVANGPPLPYGDRVKRGARDCQGAEHRQDGSPRAAQ